MHLTKPNVRSPNSRRNTDLIVKANIAHTHRTLYSTALAAGMAVLGIVTPQAAHAQQTAPFYIQEFRVIGSTKLTSLEIEEAVYPFLGPSRSVDDVEQARAALEKVFRDKGYQTVSVVIPNQDPRRGVIRLDVIEGTVGRLRVNGAKHYLPSAIKAEAPSMAEGTVPDFNKVKREILALNRQNDRIVKPDLKLGAVPGTVDIDLNVEDKLPLHGSLEINNRYSPNTTPTRLNGALSYGNLFQAGHTLGFNFQLAPERLDDALVYSGYYLARVSEGLSLMLQGTKQDSDISTLGGAAVAGRGEIIGLRALFDLPYEQGFYQTFSLGVDYKSFDETLTTAGVAGNTPIEYVPVSANYGASWTRPDTFTEANLSLNINLRGIGSGEEEFDEKRYQARGNFVYLRGDFSHTRDLENGAQWFAKLQGQLASQPLVNGEQFSGGGLGNARGYLEGTALGDDGIFATGELRSPSFIGVKDKNGKRIDEWRVHAFVDGGVLSVRDPLPAQQASFSFLSAGVGSRIRYRDHYNGSFDLAVPLKDQPNSESGEVRVTFRGWADF